MYKTYHFTKTGSGRTKGKLKQVPFACRLSTMRENIQTRLEVEEREAEAARERERECAEFMEVRAHHLLLLIGTTCRALRAFNFWNFSLSMRRS
jgi:hypothetical protein